MQTKAVDHKQALSQFGFSLSPNRGHEINDKIHDASENQLCGAESAAGGTYLRGYPNLGRI